MIIPCFRCNKEIDSPGLKGRRIPDPDGERNEQGKMKMVEETYCNADYIMAEDTIVTIIEDGKPKEIQKTAIICPDCHKDTDFVIWGIHKKEEK